VKPLIDFDSIIYKAAWKHEDDLVLAIEYAESFITKIEEKFSEKPEIFLSGPTNFRYTVDPNYKISRKDKPKPVQYLPLREHFISKGAYVSDGYEADDEVGVRNGVDCVICGIDKDLNTIPGWKYNYDKEELYNVTEDEAALNFWAQVCSGDASDDIKGLPKIGKVKALKLLEGVDVKDYRRIVEDKYLEVLGSDGFLEFDKTARLVFIKQISLTTEYYNIYP
jgi:5'-3' exonuclease